MKTIIIFLLVSLTIHCYDHGMDVSVWQGKIDWQTVKTTNIKFAIARASVKTKKNFSIFPLNNKNHFFYSSTDYQMTLISLKIGKE